MSGMSSRVEILPAPPAEEERNQQVRDDFERAYAEWLRPAPWDAESFSREQMRGLVRQVFFPGWPRPAHQVVVSTVDAGVEIASICSQMAETLSEQLHASVCLVEANQYAPGLERIYGRNRNDGPDEPEAAEAMRKSSRQVARRVWLASWEIPLGENGFSAVWLRNQLGELRRQFEYAIVHAPAASLYSETALLGNLADGVILVLQAHCTRRATALRSKQILQTANARLLGIVLSERRFPIPERIYRRL